MKVCTVCRRELALDAYHRHPATRDQRQSRCKECAIAARRAWAQANPERVRAAAAARYARVKDDPSFKAKQKEHARDYYARSGERYRVNRQRWEAENREHRRVYRREKRAANPAQTKAHHYAWIARKTATGEAFTADEFVALCARFGNRCLCCGCDGPLTADHVLPLSRGGGNTIDNIQPLCQSCNATKHVKHIDYREAAE